MLTAVDETHVGKWFLMTAIKEYIDGVIKKHLHELCKFNFFQLKVKQCETPGPAVVGLCFTIRVTHPQSQLNVFKLLNNEPDCACR